MGEPAEEMGLTPDVTRLTGTVKTKGGNPNKGLKAVLLRRLLAVFPAHDVTTCDTLPLR